MSAVLLGSFELESEEWYAARRTRLGGSEIGSVVGNGYESKFSLWCRKSGLITEKIANPVMIAGRYVEDACARWFQDQHSEFDVRETGTWVREDRPWQLANPDRLLWNANRRPAGILECKFSPYGEGWGEPGTDEIPAPYALQSRWYSNVFDDIPVYVAALVGGVFGEWRVEQDPSDLAFMLAKGREFLDTLEAGERPEIDDHEATYQAVREIHPDINTGEDHELGDREALEYLESKDAVDAAKGRHRKARSVVLDEMGSANYATWQGVRICRRQSNLGATPHLATTGKDPREQTPARTTEGNAA